MTHSEIHDYTKLIWTQTRMHKITQQTHHSKSIKKIQDQIKCIYTAHMHALVLMLLSWQQLPGVSEWIWAGRDIWEAPQEPTSKRQQSKATAHTYSVTCTCAWAHACTHSHHNPCTLNWSINNFRRYTVKLTIHKGTGLKRCAYVSAHLCWGAPAYFQTSATGDDAAFAGTAEISPVCLRGRCMMEAQPMGVAQELEGKELISPHC